MRYSKLFGKTIKSTPKDAQLVSHKLLYQGGFIRESTAGRYYLLPLGLRVQQRIQKIIKEEMDSSGAQELITPVMHPKELWKETNRTTSVGFELMSVKDRSETEFVLGGTAEEMLVDLVRKFQLSYKDLPFTLYQFSTKFRDELRARGGLLRLREFIMKDGYSFHADETNFKKEYQNMWDTYCRIYERLGLKTIVVESDNGYIGGEYCHEFVVESEVGETKFLTDGEGYAAHEDVAVFLANKFIEGSEQEKNWGEEELPMEEVEAVRGPTMQAGVALHKKPLWQQIKNVMFVNEKGEMILACIRGDLEVNEVKLLHVTKSYTLRPATETEIRAIGSEPGFISAVGLEKKVIVVADISLRKVRNAYTGANKKNKDLINVNIDRDFLPKYDADIALAKEGDIAPNGKPLVAKKGIEVGNIFQLGFHYSSKMKGAEFIDEAGKEKPYYMGCYGIGLARTLATIVEMHHDDRGIVWPEVVAPYQAHLITLNPSTILREKGEEKNTAEAVYRKLQDAGIEVLFDDRDIGAGEKFADADLIGIPIRLVVSPRTEGKIEWKRRNEKEAELLTSKEVIERLAVR